MEHQLYRMVTNEYDVTFYFVFEWRRDADWNFTDYQIPVTTFWYILEGNRQLSAFGKQHDLEPGMLVALPTNVTVSTTHANQEKAPLHYLSMGIQAIAGGINWIERYGIHIAMPGIHRHEHREFVRLWYELYDDLHKIRQFLAEESDSCISAVHASFALSWEGKLRQWLSLITQAMLPFMATPNPIIDLRVNDICTYIRRNYSQKLQSEDLAKQATLSVGHMRAVFRQVMRMSPHQYIIQTRIDKAKELLISSGLPTATIAELAGFDDFSHFVQIFRKREGVTPVAYRKRSGVWEG